MIMRTRLRLPSTTLGTLRSMHYLLQAPQVPQGVTSQSTGQLRMPHSWCWLSRPHGLPPYFAEVSSWRNRLWIPTPHDRVHLLQEPHSDMTQSTGQSLSLHSICSDRLGQTVPPFCSLWTILRTRPRLPRPHCFVQADHEPSSKFQSGGPTTASGFQAVTLQ